MAFDHPAVLLICAAIANGAPNRLTAEATPPNPQVAYHVSPAKFMHRASWMISGKSDRPDVEFRRHCIKFAKSPHFPAGELCEVIRVERWRDLR